MIEQRSLELITASLEKLKKNGMLAQDLTVPGEMILLGIGSPLDSIGFVVFITDLEERISSEVKQDVYLVLNEIHEFNVNQPHLSVAALAKYIVQLVSTQKIPAGNG